MDPGPRIDEFNDQLLELLSLEDKYTPNIQLPVDSTDFTELSLAVRDESAHVLRCLKILYELPTTVLLLSLNIMDRFLTKMKVLPKHMSCISVASFQLACSELAQKQSTDIVAISQCNCTNNDLFRMQTIIKSKLCLPCPISKQITSIDFFHVFDKLLKASDADDLYAKIIDLNMVEKNLEIIACDGSCSNFHQSVIALVVLSHHIDLKVHLSSVSAAGVLKLIALIGNLQQKCQISDVGFFNCHLHIMKILGKYNVKVKFPSSQRLIWKLSERTMRNLRPTEHLIFTLPTIHENSQTPLYFHRSGSCSSDEIWN